MKMVMVNGYPMMDFSANRRNCGPVNTALCYNQLCISFYVPVYVVAKLYRRERLIKAVVDAVLPHV
jgi:hypothetical protein